MSILIVGDNIAKLSALRAALGPRSEVRVALLRDVTTCDSDLEAIVVAANLRDVECIAALRQLLGKPNNLRRRVFIIDQRERLSAAQAYALGASHVLTNPVSARRLLSSLFDRKITSANPDKSTCGSEEAAQGGADALESMFRAVQSGSPIDVGASRLAGRSIADSIAENGLSDWLKTVRRHHEGTYQHCLLVTGIAVDFGLSLGMGQIDIERLYTAAMFHDIGKARIPLSILDKRGKLDREERAVIEGHPDVGHELLNGIVGISPEVLDGIRHHHEYLDGSGYPDALCGYNISDIVRMLTICDIFAALIERRSYKPTMSREAAYETIKSMNGKLENALVSVFREVALRR